MYYYGYPGCGYGYNNNDGFGSIWAIIIVIFILFLLFGGFNQGRPHNDCR